METLFFCSLVLKYKLISGKISVGKKLLSGRYKKKSMFLISVNKFIEETWWINIAEWWKVPKQYTYQVVKLNYKSQFKIVELNCLALEDRFCNFNLQTFPMFNSQNPLLMKHIVCFLSSSSSLTLAADNKHFKNVDWNDNFVEHWWFIIKWFLCCATVRFPDFVFRFELAQLLEWISSSEIASEKLEHQLVCVNLHYLALKCFTKLRKSLCYCII